MTDAACAAVVSGSSPFPISPFYSLSSVRLSSFSHLKHADTWKGPRLSSQRKFSRSQEKLSCQLFRKHRGRDGGGKKKKRRRRRGARRGMGGFEDGGDGRLRGDEAQTGGEEAENILRTLRLRSEKLQRGKRACVRSPCVSIHVERSELVWAYACRCVRACAWAGTVCAIRFLVHRSLEKNHQKQKKTRKTAISSTWT